MCVGYIDLKKVCINDFYPLPNIDSLVDGSSGYIPLSFMDSYSGYKQIRMSPVDEEKATFMTDRVNLYYKVNPFLLKKCRRNVNN